LKIVSGVGGIGLKNYPVIIETENRKETQQILEWSHTQVDSDEERSNNIEGEIEEVPDLFDSFAGIL
jgi:hypothetical protein